MQKGLRHKLKRLEVETKHLARAEKAFTYAANWAKHFQELRDIEQKLYPF